MRAGIELKIEKKQQQILAPQMIQTVELIQKNNIELDRYVEEELLENPILERIVEEQGEPDYRLSSVGYNEDLDYDYENIVADEITLADYLKEELEYTDRSKAEKNIGVYIIDSLDENGYLDGSVEEIAEWTGVEVSVVRELIGVIKSLGPVGICAENLEECLEYQLIEKGLYDEHYKKMIYEYLEDIAQNRIRYIASELKLKEEVVQNMIDEIRGLDPRPGRDMSRNKSSIYIIPDVIIEESSGALSVRENRRAFPKLIISSYYRKLMKLAKYEKNTEVYNYITKKTGEARAVINALEQRRRTIMNIAESIVDVQEDFFKKGIKYLKPLTMREIADKVGVHESTVSRTVNGKYLECRRGVFELRFFFPSGVKGEDGNVSADSIKTQIKKIVEKEDSSKPLSDQKIAEILNDEGVNISRRTVAKYRKGAGIMSSGKRRRV